MNREQRRAGNKDTDDAKRVADEQERKLTQQGTPPDVTSARAKSQRHGKVTADKWNQ
jgi:hypothetical protein